MLLRHVVTITDRLQAARADLARVRGGRDRHAARRRVPERRNARSCPRSSAASARRGRVSRSGSSEAASDEGLMEMVEPGPPGPHVRRPAAARGPVRRRRAPARPVRARDRRGVTAGGRWPRRPRSQLIGEQRLIGFRSCRSTKLARGSPRARTARSPTSCSAPRTTAPSRRWPSRGPRDRDRAAPRRRPLRPHGRDHPDGPRAAPDRPDVASRPVPLARRRGRSWRSRSTCAPASPTELRRAARDARLRPIRVPDAAFARGGAAGAR